MIIVGYCNSEVSEVSTWMEIQGTTNKICNLHGYSDAPITYQQSKESPINSIYCSAPLAENWGGEFLSFRRLVGCHWALWIEINENMVLCFQQHEIIPLMERNLCLGYTGMIKKFNYALHTSFLKHYIYQKIHYIHRQDIYTLPTHISRDLKY